MWKVKNKNKVSLVIHISLKFEKLVFGQKDKISDFNHDRLRGGREVQNTAVISHIIISNYKGSWWWITIKPKQK
jgi:hypothetical protein